MAKTHYCKAVKLNVNNLRALYGLFLVSVPYYVQESCSWNSDRFRTFPLQCCGHISNSKLVIGKRKEAQKLAQWAMAQIQARTQPTAKDTKGAIKTGKSKAAGCEDELQALEQAFGGLDVGKVAN